MKKIFVYLFIILLFLLFLMFIFLATKGYETSRFNNLINVEAKKIDKPKKIGHNLLKYPPKIISSLKKLETLAW